MISYISTCFNVIVALLRINLTFAVIKEYKSINLYSLL